MLTRRWVLQAASPARSGSYCQRLCCKKRQSGVEYKTRAFRRLQQPSPRPREVDDVRARSRGRSGDTADRCAMTAAGTLIVGAGQAGHTMALTMRRHGYRPPAPAVGPEPHQPYQRPPLSKAFLLGTTDVEHLALGRPNVYSEAGIDLVLGERITSITAPEPGTPGHAATDRGRVFDFDQVGLAVGGEPRRLDLPGSDLAGIHYLRSLADAHALRSSMTTARRVVVIGGGFIGLETTAAARSTGASVTVLEATEGLLSRAVAPGVSDAYAAAHRRRGVDIRLNSSAVAFEGEAAVRAVALADGSLLAADLVLVGIGMRPRLGLARQLGLRCEQGIVVDEAGRPSNPLV